MLVVLSLNTALDRVSVVRSLRIGEVHRTEESAVYAGGKALNVARALRSLGESVRVVGFLGGGPAALIEQRSGEMGLETRWVHTGGESRTCLILVDPENQRQTVVNEPGPLVTPDEVRELRTALQESLRPGDYLAIAGSAPPGVPDAFYGHVVERARGWGVKVLVDASGAVLGHALAARPWVVTPNLEEVQTILGPSVSPSGAADVLSRQADIALLTLGAEGVLCARDGQLWHLRPPSVPLMSAVGSGDAFVAGFLSGVVHDRTPLEAARLGVACGASNAARLGPGIGSREEIERLTGQVTVSTVS